MTKVEQLSLTRMDDCPENITAGFDWWCRGDALIDADDEILKRLLPTAHIAVDVGPRKRIYPYLYVGPQTTSAEVFGQDWASDCAGHVTTDTEHEGEVDFVYPLCSELQAPIFHMVDCVIRPAGRLPLKVQYWRLVLPVHSCKERRFFTIFTGYKSLGLLQDWPRAEGLQGTTR